MKANLLSRVSSFGIAVGLTAGVAAGQTASVTGRVTLEATGEPVHGAVVLIVSLGRFTTSDGSGGFRFDAVPSGRHEILVQREHLGAERQTILVKADEPVELSFSLELSPIHEEITVTTSARGESTALEQFNAVTTLDSFELAKDMAGNIGEALQNEAGVSKRSFGPAASRPVIRGFDGDRVLIMQDGMETGDLSGQSADHNVSIDPANLERIEVIKGPATLLYGSNAVGGVVNTITPQDSFRRSHPQGMRGQIVFDGASANEQLGLNGNLRYGTGGWMLWGGGGGRRTGDYGTPEGSVANSASDLSNANAGAGFYGNRAFVSIGYGIEDGRFGVPGAAEFHRHEGEEGHDPGEEAFFLDNAQRRQNVRVDLGLRELSRGFVESARVIFQYTDWRHQEIEIDEGVESVGTTFENDILTFRAELEQSRTSRLSGRFGLWAKSRDYAAIGEEALAPPTRQTAFAGFAYEELALTSVTTLSFGGRVERNDYDPEARDADEAESGVPDVRPRAFTGLSGAVGFRYDFAERAAFVTNVTRSHRAPALEELYNFGPHVGNLAFEVGSPDLERESTTGIDVGVRGRGRNLDADFNVFYYGIDNFVFPAIRDEIVDGLRLAPFEQGDARFTGFDAQASLRLSENLWVKVGLGYVDAELTGSGESLPRIPPLHGRVEVEIPYGAFTVTPEVVWSRAQNETFRNETSTGGYAVLNVKGQYTLARTHAVHIFAVNAYNLGNELYRMHTNFIKEFTPEVGRGIKFTYSLRFF